MPGAPNRPPEVAAPAPAPAPRGEAPELRLLRRLVPSHVALLLDSWKGTPPPEVVGPFEKAEAALASGDLAGASTALDLLSTRLAEPRWPTLPEPFRRLRVEIPVPVPPHWDPEHGLDAAEKETRRARRVADDQLALAEGCLAWAEAHGLATDELRPLVDGARAEVGAAGVGDGFHPRLDLLWETLRPRLPRPANRAASRSPAAPTTQGA